MKVFNFEPKMERTVNIMLGHLKIMKVTNWIKQEILYHKNNQKYC